MGAVSFMQFGTSAYSCPKNTQVLLDPHPISRVTHTHPLEYYILQAATKGNICCIVRGLLYPDTNSLLSMIEGTEFLLPVQFDKLAPQDFEWVIYTGKSTINEAPSP